MERVIDTPIGLLRIKGDEGGITEVSFSHSSTVTDQDPSGSQLVTQAVTELQEYFAGVRKTFTVPIHITKGTPFQQKVWQALQEIPYGSCTTYQDIAKSCGNEKACRAVGMANHNNPIAIIIPCHRVIGKNGSLTGYAGGLAIKKWLLALEGYKEE